MAVRIALVVVALVAVTVVALVARRRAGTHAEPVRDAYPVPRQLHREDFDRPEAPWLVALFSSDSCLSCAPMREKVAVLASDDVVVSDVAFPGARELHERYAISGVPMVLVADGDGVVRRAFVGPTSSTHLWAAVAAARAGDLDVHHGLEALET